MKGDCIYITAKYLPKVEPPLLFNNKSGANDCCYELPVFWSSNTSSSTYKYEHDYSSWIVFCEKSIQSASVFIEKYNNGWVELDQLTDNTLGTYFDLGFIDNRLEQKAVGYLLDWNLVYSEYGNGDYRLRFDQEYLLSVTKTEYSFAWTLSQYNDFDADETVRIDWTNNGLQGWFGRGQVDFMGNNYFGQIRLPFSAFGRPTDTLADEYYRLQDEKDLYKSRVIVENFKLEIRKAPAYIHTYLQYLLRITPEYVNITDYNRSATDNFRDKKVIFTKGSEPNWTEWTDKATVNYDMQEFIKDKTAYR